MKQKGLMRCIIAIIAIWILPYMMQIAVNTVGVMVLGLAGTESDLQQCLLRNGTLFLLIANLLTVLLILSVCKSGKRSMLDFCDVNFRISRACMVLCLLMGLAANIWFSLVLNLLPLPPSLMEGYADASARLNGSGRWLVDFISLVIMAPIVEELIYRGAIFRYARRALPLGAAVVLQGLLFGMGHGQIVWIAYATILGCILGYLRILTGSICSCVLFHMAFNAGSYVFGYLAETLGDSSLAIAGMLFFSAAAFVLLLYGVYYRSQNQTEKK